MNKGVAHSLTHCETTTRVTLVVLLLLLASALRADARDEILGATLREHAVTVLRDAFAQTGSLVAAVALAWNGIDSEDVLARLGGQAREGVPGRRVEVWRIVAQSTLRGDLRDEMTDALRTVAMDESTSDRASALGALARLGAGFDESQERALRDVALRNEGPVKLGALWALAKNGGENQAADVQAIATLLLTDRASSNIAATALRDLGGIDAQSLEALRRASADTDSDRVEILGVLATHDEGSARTRADMLVRYISNTASSASVKVAVCRIVADVGVSSHVPTVARALEDEAIDVRVAAAAALLRIERRANLPIAPLDWTVIALYTIALLAVGWYYSRRSKSTEDYLLGGRTMRPFAVGLSLFASLLSTLSYLGSPGELIRYGPLFTGALLGYPFAFFFTAWFVIPTIVKLPVTSAYEILEIRFGLAVRMLGSVFFLALRFVWMAVIIYATTEKVLIPILGFDPDRVPLVCALLGAVTLVYTSMGGLRAVVLTDVVQTAILFGGAILTLVLITHSLGGFGALWPDTWVSHWPEPIYGYSSTARMSLLGISLASFTWYVCTMASDQIVVQRYLATRDAKAARRALWISLVTDAAVTLFLAVLGLALMAYFAAHPFRTPDGPGPFAYADQLFPRFILIGFPAGITGLVISGLLAAAMSSLSSGLNSTSTVITVDFIERFRKNTLSDTAKIRNTKIVSVVVGVVVVVMGTFVGVVEGNLLEVAYKAVNLLVSPLAGLFFMAIFIPWSTSVGTIVGSLACLAVVISVNYWKQLTGTAGISFVWAMPFGLLAQIVVGGVVSLLPLARKTES